METSKQEKKKAEVKPKEEGIGGASPRTNLEYMRIKAWMAYLMAKSRAATYKELNDCLLSSRVNGQPKVLYIAEMSFPDVRWDRHWNLETGPNETHLNLIDRMPLLNWLRQLCTVVNGTPVFSTIW